MLFPVTLREAIQCAANDSDSAGLSVGVALAYAKATGHTINISTLGIHLSYNS